MIFNIDAQVILGNDIDLSPFVISYTRTHSMCNISHTGEIKLSPNVLVFLDLNEIDIQVYEPIRIIEYGKTVLTGYVARIAKQRTPATTVSVFISDKFKRAKDYFIDNPDFQTNGETLPGMFATLCEMAGLDHINDSPQLESVTLPPGEPLGLMTVDGAIGQIVGYATAITYVDGNGVVHIRKGFKTSGLQFSSGATVPDHPTTPSDITQGNVFAGTYIESDENARDVVSVWGYRRPNPFSTVEEDLRIIATRSVDLGLPVHKTMVYSSSLIQTQTEADRLADEMIKDVGKLEQTVTLECQGDPEIAIVKKASINVNLETMTLFATKKITSVVATVSAEGYIMNVTFDEFCPKFAGWALTQEPAIFYAGTVRHGVYKSLDSGLTWFEYNNGLPEGYKRVTSLAATENDEVMAIVNGQLWYVTSSGLTIPNPEWKHRYLPAPTNGALDNPPPSNPGTLITVTSAGSPANFEVLATKTQAIVPSGLSFGNNDHIYRSWVYNTADTGNVWNSEPISAEDDLGNKHYSFNGIHMSNRYGTPRVTANTGAEFFNGLWIYRPPLVQTCYFFDYGLFPLQTNRVDLPHYGYNFGVYYWDFVRTPDGKPRTLLFGMPGNRVASFEIYVPNLTLFPYAPVQFTPPGGTGQAQTDVTFLMTVGIGDVIIYDYEARKEGDIENLPQGVYISPQMQTPQGFSWNMTFYESMIGNPAFWIKWSFRSQAHVFASGPSFPYQEVYKWTSYSGEERIPGYNHDEYPWDYWSLGFFSPRPKSIYPCYLGAGFLKINFNELENNR